MVPLSRHLVDTTLNQVSLCYYISGSEKRIGASKGATHPEAERIAMKEVKTRWESGNPVTRPEVYNLLRNSYDPSTSFHKLLGSVASIHMMKEGKCFLRTWRLWMTTLSIKVCLHQTKLIIWTESFPVLDTVYHFITTTVCFQGGGGVWVSVWRYFA